MKCVLPGKPVVLAPCNCYHLVGFLIPQVKSN